MSTSKPWIKNYPPGVDPEIGPLAYSSLAEFFDSAFDRFGNRNVAESMGKFFTYHEVDRLSKDFASTPVREPTIVYTSVITIHSMVSVVHVTC